MSGDQTDSFRFLQRFWPRLHELGRQAEQAEPHETDLAAIRLRGLTETMVMEIFSHLGLPHDRTQTHFSRLLQLEAADLLDARLLSKFHAIRKLGNNAAHNRTVTHERMQTLLEDAWSLACWFCRFVRPDVEWLIPARRDAGHLASQAPPSEPDVSAKRQPTASGRQLTMLRLPEERIRRIQEQVVRAMAAVDPRVRQLRTRITLHEAFTERLSDDQAACLDALSAFLADREQRIFLLKGYAGTGKTFLAKGITEYFSAQGRAFRLAAPTGRAAKVIADKTGRDARTVHALIYDFDDVREYAADEAPGSETFKFYARISLNRDQANTVYIVDEASLLSDIYSESTFFRAGTGYLLHDLISYVGFEHGETDRKIILIGDPAQLRPVGMSTSPALDSGYLRQHFGLASTGYELTELLRQKADSSIIRNVMPLRENLSKGVFGGLGFEFDEDVQRLRSDEVLPLYLAARPADGSSVPIIITESNKAAMGFNRMIRAALFPETDVVAAGDRLIISANALVGGIFLANGEFIDVATAELVVERRWVTLQQRDEATGTMSTIEVPLVFRDVQIILSSPDGSKAILAAKILDDYLHDDRAGLEDVQQRALYVDFLKRHPDLRQGHERERLGPILRQDPYFNALRVRFGYAVTCHKAQGGEWQHVFVSCPSGRDPRSADYLRWLYTAMTRSSRTLYLIDPPEVRLKIAGADWWSNPGMSPASAHAAPASEPINAGYDTSQQAFQIAMLDRVQDALARTGIVIDDVAHHQYQEAFYCRRDTDAARANVSYNGKLKVTAVAALPAGLLGAQLAALLQPLVGQVIGTTAGQAGPAGVQVPTRPFLAAFHGRLLPLLKQRGIQVSALKEQPWSQRYTFARGQDAATVDVYYDGRDRLTKCMPVNAGKRQLAPIGTLLPEVLEVLTSQVVL